MKTALNTREPRIICPTLKILQQMILLSPMVGQALVPYYRQVRNLGNQRNREGGTRGTTREAREREGAAGASCSGTTDRDQRTILTIG